MGPQSGSCGYPGGQELGGHERDASMGPQSGSCGYADPRPPVRRRVYRFNGSTVW